MVTPTRHRPYLDHPRPLAQATIATRALSAVSGDEDQVALVRPYLADPHNVESRRRANHRHVLHEEDTLKLLVLIGLAQTQEGQ